eukprot:1405950-Rhodomonas_salina.5
MTPRQRGPAAPTISQVCGIKHGEPKLDASASRPGSCACQPHTCFPPGLLWSSRPRESHTSFSIPRQGERDEAFPISLDRYQVLLSRYSHNWHCREMYAERERGSRKGRERASEIVRDGSSLEGLSCLGLCCAETDRCPRLGSPGCQQRSQLHI